MKVSKIMSGWYRMGRFEIERVQSEWIGKIETVWHISEDGIPFETFDTLRECKAFIIRELSR